MTQGYLEEELEVLVVGDDAVVDDDELVVLAGGVRVGVDRGRNTVGGPPSEQFFYQICAYYACLSCIAKQPFLGRKISSVAPLSGT